MPDYRFHPAAPVVRRSIHSMLAPFPLACFVGTLLTDLTYWGTAEMMWADFSAWLVSAGFILGVLAAIAGLIEFIARPALRARRPAWPHALGTVVALVLALLNTMIHSRDAWTSVVPTGLVLSALTVAVLLFTGWIGATRVDDPVVPDPLMRGSLAGYVR